ncbi:hypothetical protein D9X30_2277 [Cupriavidus sp. U2]|nr:hypothetical protein D9X30_2277 [Cupriavidus sp. U2]
MPRRRYVKVKAYAGVRSCAAPEAQRRLAVVRRSCNSRRLASGAHPGGSIFISPPSLCRRVAHGCGLCIGTHYAMGNAGSAFVQVAAV